MLVVPVRGDRVLTKDHSEPLTVSSYTNLKPAPAVYVRGEDFSESIELASILELNGVKVKFHKDAKVLEALGPLRRRHNLPQPGDKITVRLIKLPTDAADATEQVDVKHLRLHDQGKGISRGLLACSADACYTLKDVIAIDRKVGSEPFDAKSFQRYYLDYMPYSGGEE